MAGISTPSRQIPWNELESIAPAAEATEPVAIRGRVPKFIVEPATGEQVAAVLRWANENSVALAASWQRHQARLGRRSPRARCGALDAQDESGCRACMGRHDGHG